MIFDAHCDTVFEILQKEEALPQNSLHLDLERMQEYQGYIQVFAAFIDQKNVCISPLKHCFNILENAKNEIAKNKGLALIKDITGLKNVVSRKGTGAILAIEGGEALEGNLSNLALFFQMGVRLITLTWNYANELADGIMEPRGGGLTDFGVQVVKMMEKMGMIVDVSHLSEKGFWDVAEVTQYPFVASHSCVKKLCSHPRNLNDAQIKLLIERKGGMGINFYPPFLTEDSKCTIKDILRHMEYVLELGGEQILGLGSDFDGVDQLPDGICGVESVKDVVSAMEKAGFSKKIILNITFQNFYRIFSQTFDRTK